MANYECDACEQLRTEAPNFIINGLGDEEIEHLTDGNGLTGKSDNCTDVNNMNDCLIGMMDKEINGYEACDWKVFMKRFIQNLWTVLKSIITWLCGVDCRVNYMINGASFRFSEDNKSGESILVPGKGVDFSIRHSGQQHTSDVTITYISGGLCRLTGSLRTFIESFADADGKTQPGNTVWDFSSNNYDLPEGGELLYEIRLKKSEYPQIKRFFRGNLYGTAGGQKFFQVMAIIFDGDSTSDSVPTVYAYGQHGWCDDDGTPSKSGYSSGHKVPKGWIYIQARMGYVGKLNTSDVVDGKGNTKRGTSFTPGGFIGVRMNSDEITCD